MLEKTRLGTLVITLRDLIERARATPMPADDEAPELFGFMRGSVTIHGDLTEPLDEVWEVDAYPLQTFDSSEYSNSRSQWKNAAVQSTLSNQSVKRLFLGRVRIFD